jgi:transcriptional regulator with XRE-family HTH domain
MGNARSPKPERLAEKLLQIRLILGLSQDGMLERLGLAEEYFRSRISAYELGNREPHLPILLKYARSVGISTDVLIDDEMDLPEKLLKDSKRRATGSKSTSKSKGKR